MKTLTLAVALLATTLAVGCGGTDSASKKPGNPAVYERIEATSDCGQLQHEFDTAMANFDRVPKGTDRSTTSLAYAEAAQARIEKVGCP